MVKSSTYIEHHADDAHNLLLVEVIKNKLFYSSPIRFGIISYLSTVSTIAVFLIIAMYRQEYDDPIFYLYLVGVLMLIIWPIWTMWFLLKHNVNLLQKSYKIKF